MLAAPAATGRLPPAGRDALGGSDGAGLPSVAGRYRLLSGNILVGLTRHGTRARVTAG